MWKECFWEEEPIFVDLAEREKLLKQIAKEEYIEERMVYEKFKNNREPFEWYCYEDIDSVA